MPTNTKKKTEPPEPKISDAMRRRLEANKCVPCHVPTERALLDVILRGGTQAMDDAVTLGLLPGDFYEPAHSALFALLSDMHTRNKAIDLVTVSEEAEKAGMLAKVGGVEGLAAIGADGLGLPGHVAKYAGTIKRYSVLRRLIAASEAITARAVEAIQEDGAAAAVDDAEEAIYAVRKALGGQDQTGPKYSDEVLLDTLREIEARQVQKEGLAGVPSGLAGLDRLTMGFQPGHLIILAGRPAMGKSALAMNLALAAAIPQIRDRDTLTEGVPAKNALIFSLEMTSTDLTIRNLSRLSGVAAEEIKYGRMTPEDVAGPMTSAGKALMFKRIALDDTPAITLPAVRARARQIDSRYRSQGQKLDMIIIDYLQLMGTPAKAVRELEVAELSRGLKTLAKEMGVPVLALSQLNRKLEERNDKTPMLSDLRESGAIEQDADIVMFVHRPEVYLKGDEKEKMKGKAQVIIAKNRHGRIGTVDLAFNGERTSFFSIDKNH